MITAGLFSSSTDDWATPSAFFQDLDARFGFTLDPCASAANHKCAKYYTKEQDGLQYSWGGSVYFVTHHTDEILRNGCASATKKASAALSWLCSYQRELIRRIFTITYTTRHSWSLYGGGFISTMRQRVRRSRQCL